MKKVLIIIGLITIMSLGFVSYNKAHTIRYCRVTQEHDKVITVLHPNGEVYDFYAYDSQLYKEDTIVKVSFNELKFDKEYYSVNSGNPKVILTEKER